MKEALYYEKKAKKLVHCLLCPRSCTISDGTVGFCGVRKNIKGKLFSIVYGKPVSVAVDPIEKKPLYHFHPGSKIYSFGTFGCNLRCQFCQNYGISQVKEILDYERIIESLPAVSPNAMVKDCTSRGLKLLAFTYNEPTVFYEYMLDIAKECKKNKIEAVMVSNGQINEKPLKKLLPFIDAFNIDLKSFSPDFYRKTCFGTIEDTKRTIRIVSEAKKHQEVTLLLIEGHNDNEDEFRQYCKFLANIDNEIPLHISRAFPCYKMRFRSTSVKRLKKFESIAKEYLVTVHIGNLW
jgi:pyruvate formate lyase activating enzyme